MRLETVTSDVEVFWSNIDQGTGYVRNNPLRYIDPDGHLHKEVEVLVQSTEVAVKTTIASGFKIALGVAGGLLTFATPTGSAKNDDVLIQESKEAYDSARREKGDRGRQSRRDVGVEEQDDKEKQLQPAASGGGARKGGKGSRPPNARNGLQDVLDRSDSIHDNKARHLKTGNPRYIEGTGRTDQIRKRALREAIDERNSEKGPEE